MSKIAIGLFFVISIFGSGCKQKVSEDVVKALTPQETQVFIQHDGMQVIDVRTPKEFMEGHLKNAKNIDFLETSFQERIKSLDKNKPILVYCRSGNRSNKSLDMFLKAGYTNLYHMKGGILEWNDAGFKKELE